MTFPDRDILRSVAFLERGSLRLSHNELERLADKMNEVDQNIGYLLDKVDYWIGYFFESCNPSGMKRMIHKYIKKK